MPQITLGTPKIRLQGFSRFARNGHMQLDTAQAPFVQTGVQQTIAQDSGGLRNRQATMDEDEDTPTIPRQATPSNDEPPGDSTKTRRGTPSCTEDCNQRLDRLEKCVQKQCEALNKCMDLLSRTNCTTPVGGHAHDGYRQVPEPYPQTEVPTRSPNVEVIPSSGPSRIPAPEPIPMPPEPEREELGNYQAPPRSWDRQVQQTSYVLPMTYTVPLLPPQILPLPPITEER